MSSPPLHPPKTNQRTAPHFLKSLSPAYHLRRVNSLKDLLDLSIPNQFSALKEAGLSTSEIEDVNTFLSVLPAVTVAVTITSLDGDPTIVYGDFVQCMVRVLLTRPSHYAENAVPIPSKGKPVRAYTPQYPLPHDEAWFFLVGGPST